MEVDNARSEIFVRITKEVGGLTDNRVSHLTFYLADVEAFMEPISVIPDIGGAPNDYFVVRDRDNWKQAFSAWLHTPMNIEEEISESESDSDSSRQADNWDSSSLDSGNEHSNSGEDTSSSE